MTLVTYNTILVLNFSNLFMTMNVIRPYIKNRSKSFRTSVRRWWDMWWNTVTKVPHPTPGVRSFSGRHEIL